MTAASTSRLPARQRMRIVAAGSVGTMVEWFDYYLYGFAAALIFDKVFFPQLDGLTGTLASFGSYAVGFLARPVGGLVFGRLGDRIGRRPVLVLTMTLMGLATVGMGLLPGYATLGVWAAVLLTALRLVQGFAAGAEWGGATLMAAESAPPRRRALYACIPTTGVAISIVLAIGSLQLLTALLSPAELVDWGWRIPFLASAVLVAIGLFLRAGVPESPEFTALQERRTVAEHPVRELLRRQPMVLLLAVGARAGEVGPSYLLMTFALTYLAHRGDTSPSTGMTSVLVAASLGIVTVPLFGAVADRIGRRELYLIGTAGLAVFAFPYFWLLDSGSDGLAVLAQVVAISVLYCAISGAQPGLFAELFDPDVRMTGIAITREVSAPITGGTAPFVATALLIAGGGSSWPIALYMIALTAISVVSLVALGVHLRRRGAVDGRTPAGAVASV
jgi:MFS transporter, MHS family, shikimate and dehydroshikimate transport protein